MNNENTEKELLKNTENQISKIFLDTLDDFERTQYFGCDCGDPAHVLLASYFESGGTEEKELLLTMETYAMYIPNTHDNKFFSSLKKFHWRIKVACKVLFTGNITFSSSWIPARRKSEKIPGEKEVRKLIKFLKYYIEDYT